VRALVTLAGEAVLPRRFIAGADAIETAEQKTRRAKAADRRLSGRCRPRRRSTRPVSRPGHDGFPAMTIVGHP
jgi:hypothetical protein